MQTATKEFINCMNNGYPEYARAKITLTNNYVINVAKDDFLMDSNGFRIESSSSSSSSFDVGSAIATQLTIKLINSDGKYNGYDFWDAQISEIYVGMELPSGKIEEIQTRNYTVDSQDFNGGIVTLTCYDNLGYWGDNYSGTKKGSAIYLITELATKHGITLANNNFPNCNYEVTLEDFDGKYTDKEILQYLLEITGNYAIVDTKNYLSIQWYEKGQNGDIIYAREDANTLIDAGDISQQASIIYSPGICTNLPDKIEITRLNSIDISDIYITGVSMEIDGTEYMAGNKGYVISLSANNPFVTKQNAQIIVDNVWNSIEGTSFRPINFDTLSNPLIEIGDKVIVELREGIYETIITNIDFAIGNDTTCICGAESPGALDNKPNSNTAQVANRAANRAVSAYDALNKQLINLVTMSMGLFEIKVKQADGSEIIYLTNKPTLEESLGGTVWRIALDVFTVTNNYQGESTVWTSGFDSQGNLLVNSLSAIGINADWIKAGTLTGRKINNGYGTFSVDENGKVIAKDITADGGKIGGFDIGSGNGSGRKDGFFGSNCAITKEYMSYGTKGWRVNSDGEMYSAVCAIQFLYLADNWGNKKWKLADTISDDGYSTMNYQVGQICRFLFESGSEAFRIVEAKGKGDFAGSYLRRIEFKSQVYYDRTPITSSDKDLKKNIKRLDKAKSLKLMMSLKPSSYKYKNSDILHHGFIAQDVFESIDDSPWGVYSDTGKKGGKGLAYEEFIADIVCAMQALKEEVDTLKKEVKKLKEGNKHGD